MSTPRRAALRGALLFLSFAGTFLGAVFAFALILEPYANAQPEPQVVAAPAPPPAH